MKLQKVLIYMLIFLTPLIFTTNTNELYEFPKMFFVYIGGATLITLFLLKKLVSFTPSPILRPSKEVLFFVAAYIISTIFSMHLYTSVWGYYTRFNGGFISVLLFLGIYITAKNTPLKNVLTCVAITALPVGIYSVIQHFGFFGIEKELRVFSTFGQPNWSAAYLAMILPVVLIKSFVEWHLRFFWSAVFCVGYAGMWYSYSLSGLLGFAVAMTALVVLNRKLFKVHLKPVLIISAVVFLISITSLGVFETRVSDTVTDIKKVTFLTTHVFAQDSHKLADSGFIRTGLWKGTLNLITSNPKIFLIGTGPETFPYAFQPFRPRELNYSSEWDFVFNKPHNYYLELFANTGFLGLLAYLILIFKMLRSKHTVIVPSLIALFVSNIFSWPTVATALVFWVFLGLLETKSS